ncbi:6-bladed beta-propeller [Noviherbaspirillum sp. ST9]|uniref:6-bladed beta-propeller n=1 Tax=Noviherbaspirillum sp. ST9 TaxID=3401606 RepID=UPI003B589AE4
MHFLPAWRLAALSLLAALLTGCASNVIRGHFDYDARPKNARPDLVWPQPPDPPRYRYVGELVGERNFTRTDKTETTLVSAMNWIVGLFETEEVLTLQRPQHGTTDDKGRIYVVDAGRNAVVVFDPNPPADGKSNKEGGQLMVWKVLQPDMAIGSPIAVEQVWDGHIAVSDAMLGAVFRVNSAGEPVSVLGVGQLKRPTGLAFDKKRGLLYVADTVENDIKVYDGTGQLVNTFGGAGEREGSLNGPTLMSFDDKYLYVTDTLNSRVQVYDSEGNHLRSFGERGTTVGNMVRPKGVAVGDDIVYVVESLHGHLLAFNQKAQLLLAINGSGMKDDRFTLPSGVWTDSKGRVYVADMYNNRVVVFQFLGNKTE